MDLKTDVVRLGHSAIVLCEGALDASTKAQLLLRIQETIEPGSLYLLLDLSSLGFADSTALEVMESAYRMTREEGIALEIHAGEAIRRVLDVLGPPDTS